MGNVIGKVHETVDGFEWRIDKFYDLTAKDRRFTSPPFFYNGISWRLRMESCVHPSDLTLGWIDLYVINESCKSPTYAEFSLALRHVTGRKVLESHCTEVFTKGHDRHFFRQFQDRRQLIEWKSELVPSGGITVVFAVKILKSVDEAGKSFE